MGLPVGVGEFVGWIEDGHGAAFVAVTPRIVAPIGVERLGGGRDILDPRVQGRLIDLYLNEEGEVGLFGELEKFF
jgi:hypothetical protein